MKTQKRRRYRSVQDWMMATGTNNVTLARRLGIKESHMSNVLKKSRRCSLDVAVKMHKITGVPIETIAEWPPRYEESV